MPCQCCISRNAAGHQAKTSGEAAFRSLTEEQDLQQPCKTGKRKGQVQCDQEPVPKGWCHCREGLTFSWWLSGLLQGGHSEDHSLEGFGDSGGWYWEKTLGQVMESQSVEGFRGEHQNLKLDPRHNKQQKQVSPDRGDVVKFTHTHHQPGDSILKHSIECTYFSPIHALSQKAGVTETAVLSVKFCIVSHNWSRPIWIDGAYEGD